MTERTEGPDRTARVHLADHPANRSDSSDLSDHFGRSGSSDGSDSSDSSYLFGRSDSGRSDSSGRSGRPAPVLPGARTGREPERSIRPGPRRVPHELVAATQRERLLDGVARTVAEQGYAGAKVSDICRAAGVTRPVFYVLFSGKEDAVLAAYRLGIALVVQAMEQAYEEEGGARDWPAAVRAGLEALLRLLAGNPAFAAMVVEVEGVGAAGRAERERLLGRFRTFFTAAPPLPAAGPPPETPAAPRAAVDRPSVDRAPAPRAPVDRAPAPRAAVERPPVDRASVERAELVDALVGAVHAALYRRIAQGDVEGLPGLLPTLVRVVLSPFGLPGAEPRPLPQHRPSAPGS